MDRAVKEIVSSIVQRSVSIATQTTKELVLKVCFFSMLILKGYCFGRCIFHCNLFSKEVFLNGRTMPWSQMKPLYEMPHI